MKKHTHRVIRISTGGNCGEHSSRALAEKRIGSIVAQSRGRLTHADFKIEEIT
jgi:hypothetical protein